MPGCPVVKILCIDRIIQIRELRYDDHDRACDKEKVAKLQTQRGALQSELLAEHAVQELRYRMRDEELKEIDQAVAQPYDEHGGLADVAAVDIAAHIKNKHQHGADLHQRKDAFFLRGEGSDDKGQKGEDSADAAHVKHENQLVVDHPGHSAVLLALS